MIPVRAEHAPFWLAAHAVVLLALLLTARGAGVRWRWLGLGALVALGWWAAATAVAAALPVAWLQPIREGFTPDHLRYALADSSDTGKLPSKVLSPLLAPGLYGLRQAVARNLTCHGWAALLFAALMARRAGWTGGALFGGVVLLGPLGLTAALSEVNASVAALYLAALGALLPTATGAVPGRRAIAAAGALVVAGLLAAVRDELVLVTAAVGVAVVLAALPVRVGWAERVDRAGAALRQRPWLLPGGLSVWVALSWLAHEPAADTVARQGQLGWLWLSLHPLNVHGLLLPLCLFATLSPGLVLLAARGAWAGVRRPLRHGFAPVALWVLFVSAWSAGHGPADLDAPGAVAPWELYRYLLTLAPIVWLLAIAGASGPLPRSLLIALLVPPLPWLRGLLDTEPVGAAPWPLLWPATSGSAPDEVRAIVGLLDEVDRQGVACPILTRGRAWGGSDAPWVWAVITRVGDRPPRLELLPGDRSGPSTPIELPPCSVLWWGLDCEADRSQCPERAPPAEVRVFTPFVHPEHGMTWPAQVQTGALPWWERGG
jgi:hypothetical protein